MIIFFQELVLLLFLWLLRLIDGLMELFNGISGVTDVMLNGRRVNIIDALVGDSTVSIIFWCIFILAIGLSSIFTIVAFVKNMISNNRSISGILGKFCLSLLGTMAMLAVVFLGILISNATLKLVAEIFQIGNTTKLSNMIFESCVGDWVNGYSISEIDVATLSVSDIFGGYKATLFGIWPTEWKLNGMVNPETFLYLPALICSIGVIISLIIAVVNLAKRVYEIVFMYIIMPLSMSTISLDDGARFKIWREVFVTKILLAYGSVFAVNIFILILPIIMKMQIPEVSSFAKAIFRLFMIVGGCLLIPAGQNLFARLFGQAEDLHAGGSFLRSAFYGGRIASALTIGTASKAMKGAFRLGKKTAGAIKKYRVKSGGDADDSDKFTESEQKNSYLSDTLCGQNDGYENPAHSEESSNDGDLNFADEYSASRKQINPPILNDNNNQDNQGYSESFNDADEQTGYVQSETFVEETYEFIGYENDDGDTAQSNSEGEDNNENNTEKD